MGGFIVGVILAVIIFGVFVGISKISKRSNHNKKCEDDDEKEV